MKTLFAMLVSPLALAGLISFELGSLADTGPQRANRDEPFDCDPRYEGHCVPICSDVDCEGGSGNGPCYVPGPFFYQGSDPYDLDRDSDGIACEL
jgi:hypothetical protein